MQVKPPSNAKTVQVYVFSGEDEYISAQAAAELVDRLVPAGERTLGLEVVMGAARNAAEAADIIARCAEALRTPGFMGARKVVWLKNASFFDRGNVARSTPVIEALAGLARVVAGRLPANNILVLTAPAFDKASPFCKACIAKGEIVDQGKLNFWDKAKAAEGFVSAMLRKDNLKAQPGTAEAIVARAGTDSRLLAGEIKKLALYAHPSREIGPGDVSVIVSPSREGVFTDLADAASARDLPGALVVLRQLMFHNESAIGMISFLESRFRLLYFLRRAESEGERDVGALLSAGGGKAVNPYYLKRLASQARNFSVAELEGIRQAIIDTRLKLVSSSVGQNLLLEKLLVLVCGRRRPARTR